jgi:hypothetical protein
LVCCTNKNLATLVSSPKPSENRKCRHYLMPQEKSSLKVSSTGMAQKHQHKRPSSGTYLEPILRPWVTTPALWKLRAQLIAWRVFTIKLIFLWRKVP